MQWDHLKHCYNVVRSQILCLRITRLRFMDAFTISWLCNIPFILFLCAQTGTKVLGTEILLSTQWYYGLPEKQFWWSKPKAVSMVVARVSYHLPVNATDLHRGLQSYYSCQKSQKGSVLITLNISCFQGWAKRLFYATKLDVSSVSSILHDAHRLPLLLIVTSLSTYMKDFPHGHGHPENCSLSELLWFRISCSHHYLIWVTMAYSSSYLIDLCEPSPVCATIL